MKRIHYLDGVRGISALIVVVHHYAAAFLPALYLGDPKLTKNAFELIFYNTPLAIFFNGNSAVCIFFVLSGYLVAQKIKNSGAEESVLLFTIRRYCRFMMPILGVVAITYAFMKVHIIIPDQVSLITHSSWLATQWQSELNIYSMLQSGLFRALLTYDREYLSILWTMHIIFLGSIGTFTILKYTHNKKIRWILYVFLTLLLFRSYYLAFIFGALIGEAKGQLPTMRYAALKIILWLSAWILLAYPLTAAQTGIHPYIKLPFASSTQNIISMHIIGAALALYAIMESPIAQKIIANKFFLYVGKISFSLYLVHLIILGALATRIFLITNSVLPYYVSIFIVEVISFPATLLFAYIYTRTAEQWGIRISNTIAGVMQRRIPSL